MENKPTIKSFIYLDEDKMFSISSQLFEGITEYILKEDTNQFQQEEKQKGQFFSGKFMADMMFKSNTMSEKRSLHDFAYNLFEKELERRGFIYDISSEDTLEDLHEKDFVRVKGKLFFYDYEKMNNTIDNFNELGRAIAKLQMIDNNLYSYPELTNKLKSINDREQKNKVKNQAKVFQSKVDQILKEEGLILDEDYRKALSTLLHYGYNEKYAINLCLDNSNIIYSSAINPEYLKEKENLLVSKYSRQTEREFTVVGILTQTGIDKAPSSNFIGNEMKAGIYQMNEKIGELEESFNGRAKNECVIDPIAIFTEI